MKNDFIAMGEFYRANPYGLVKTVCKGYDSQSGEAYIAYANVLDGGLAGDIFFMPEEEFRNIFLN